LLYWYKSTGFTGTKVQILTLRALAATAQVAAQEGKYLGMRLSAMPTAYEESSILNAAKRKILALQVPSLLALHYSVYWLYEYKCTNTDAGEARRATGNADLLQRF